MLIIVEGIDRSGKSTLCHRIETELGYKYKHFSTPGPDPAAEYRDFLLTVKEPTVTDRFYLGERVYGPLLRGTTKITDLEWYTLERMCRKLCATLILADTPIEVCQNRFDNKGVTLEQNVKAHAKFKEVFAYSNINSKIIYDGSSEKNTDDVVHYIKALQYQKVEVAQEALRFDNGIGTVIGRKLVLVGEAVNHNHGAWNLPFCRGPASEFLLNAMKYVGIPEELVYICNADKLTLAEAQFLDTTHWLAMGSKAHVKLNKLGIDHSVVNHPQYENRFRHNTGEFLQMLRAWKERCLYS